MALVGLVPAAGSARRLQPIRGSKEVQQIRGRPVMDYLLDRMDDAGCDRVVVVVRPDKDDVALHARRRGAEVTVGQPATVTDSLLLGMSGLGSDDIVIFGFPDTIWTPRRGFEPLAAAVRGGEPLALGLFASPHADRSDTVELDRRGRVRRVLVKQPAASRRLVWACGAARVDLLRKAEGSPEAGDFFNRIAADRPIAGIRLGRMIDVGTREDFVAAATDPVFDELDAGED